MKTEQKDLFDNDHVPKQPYTKPQLTVYGTVEEITGQGGAILKDSILGGTNPLL